MVCWPGEGPAKLIVIFVTCIEEHHRTPCTPLAQFTNYKKERQELLPKLVLMLTTSLYVTFWISYI